jgi:hypothetical protein
MQQGQGQVSATGKPFSWTSRLCWHESFPLQKTTLRVIDGMRRQQRLDSMEKQKAEADAILASLRQDPSLKYRIGGRQLLQALLQRPGHVLDQNSVSDIPNH